MLKQRLEQMDKQTRIGFRISQEDKDVWELYSISVGYESLGAFIRDSINALIRAEKKPIKLTIIK